MLSEKHRQLLPSRIVATLYLCIMIIVIVSGCTGIELSEIPADLRGRWVGEEGDTLIVRVNSVYNDNFSIECAGEMITAYGSENTSIAITCDKSTTERLQQGITGDMYPDDYRRVIYLNRQDDYYIQVESTTLLSEPQEWGGYSTVTRNRMIGHYYKF